jgi:hypothetical protein
VRLKLDQPSHAAVKSDDEIVATGSTVLGPGYTLRIDASTWHGGREHRPFFTASAKLFHGSKIVAAFLAEPAPIVHVPVADRANKDQSHQSGVAFVLINVEAFSLVSTNEALLTTNAENLTYELARAAPAGTIGGTDRMSCSFFGR